MRSHAAVLKVILMPSEIHEVLQDRERSNWVRLRTLLILRWFAVAGQAGAIFVAIMVYDLRIEVTAALVTILASVWANTHLLWLYILP